MKTVKYFVIAFVLVAFVIKFSSCCDDCGGYQGVDNLARGMSQKTWTIKSVTVDGNDRTGTLFKDMTLKFKGKVDPDTGVESDQTYETVNGKPVWPVSGKWSFYGNKSGSVGAYDIRLNENGLVMKVEYSNVLPTLTCTFDWAQPSTYGGREASIRGKHVMVFE